jgi:hypothetical protein
MLLGILKAYTFRSFTQQALQPLNAQPWLYKECSKSADPSTVH